VSGGPFEVLYEPAPTLLSRHGIRYRVKRAGGVTWFNMSKCPLCGHENYQCGVSESIGANGRLRHAVKCFHISDNGTGTDTPEYEDFLFRLGELDADSYNRLRNISQRGRVSRHTSASLQAKDRGAPPFPSAQSAPAQRSLNLEFLAVLRKRLRENPEAMSYLTSRGLNDEALDHFRLGLSTPYTRRKTDEEQSDALVYPMRGPDGVFYNKYGYYNIPNVTKNPVDKNGWMKGEVRTYYSDGIGEGRVGVFICEGAKDVWRHWQALAGTIYGNELLLITSTHGTGIPDEWKSHDFWERWDNVYLGQDNDEAGDFVAAKLAGMCGRDVRRVLVPKSYGKDWTDFWQQGGTIEEFGEILRNAPVVSQTINYDEPTDGAAPGRFAYAPIDINGAFHNGHLYYTAQTLQRELEMGRNETGEDVVQVLERLETVVVRSDRTVHTARWSPAPKGTQGHNRVLRLTDGTLITREPQLNKYATWTWPSIQAYLEGKLQTRPLSSILRDMLAHLKASVWLPYDEDYALLALVVPVTYTQTVFESVPLIFLNGPAGSGKSQMGRSLARLCANAYVCGQSSAASIARFIDESRGFVVLDDLETIGRKGEEYSELTQALKQSYNRDTAVKLWTDIKTMRTERLNFFGVKMINNTQGADHILGSRMLRVQTRKIPDHLKDDFADLRPTESRKLDRLRDEMHTWAFEHVAEVDAEYRRMFPKNTDRADEIAAPLKVFASLAGDDELKSNLEIALLRQKHKTVDQDDPVQVMHEALRNLVAQGYSMISITHLVLEMRSLISENYGKGFTNEIPEWARPDWVGKQLRTHDLIETGPDSQERKRLYGTHLRFYRISREFVGEVCRRLAEGGTQVEVGKLQPTAFCQGCEGCPYSANNCEIMPKRLNIEGRSYPRKRHEF